MSDNAASHDKDETRVHSESEQIMRDIMSHADQSTDAVDQSEGTTQAMAMQDVDMDMGDAQFDPATLANLAALSRIANDEGMEEDIEDDDFSSLISAQNATLTSQQVQDFVDNLGTGREEDARGRTEDPEEEAEEERQDDNLTEEGTRDEERDGDQEYGRLQKEYEGGRRRGKRNRTTL
jgi:hypothetical protein